MLKVRNNHMSTHVRFPHSMYVLAAACSVDMVSFLARRQMIRAWEIDWADLNANDGDHCWSHYTPDTCARAANAVWTKPAAADITVGFSIA